MKVTLKNPPPCFTADAEYRTIKPNEWYWMNGTAHFLRDTYGPRGLVLTPYLPPDDHEMTGEYRLPKEDEPWITACGARALQGEVWTAVTGPRIILRRVWTPPKNGDEIELNGKTCYVTETHDDGVTISWI